MVTYYDILQVSRRAAPVGLRASYRKLAQKYHPDKLPGNADAERVMAMLNEAYGVLSDPQRRAEYDRRISHERSSAQRRKRLAAEAMHAQQPAWPWYLLFATVAFAAASVGTVVYKSVVPPVAIAVAVPSAPAAPGKN
jgi:curved DNA-binding protein CbpA